MKRLVTQQLAQSAQIMNLLGGGLAPSELKIKKNEDHYLIMVKVPGLHADSYEIELNNKQLFIFQHLKVEENLRIPYLLRMVEIPADVDFEQINARYESNQLLVVLPFNELATGYMRNIEIEK